MEFKRIADMINSIIAEMGMKVDDIPSVLSQELKSEFNCYPGEKGGGCHEIAFFISLNGKVNALGRGHLKFSQALEFFVRHMQGYCPNYTKAAVIITDQWEADAYKKWEANIQQVKQYAHIEIYVLTGRSVNNIII